MKKTAVFLAFLFAVMSGASAALTSKGYVDAGLAGKQDTLKGSGAVTIDQANNTVSVATASATTAGVATLGTIPVGETGTTTAKIWVE
jgi:hypothetical protein